MDVSIEDAYRVACMALGEAIVRERILTIELDRVNEQGSGNADVS